MFVEVFIVFRVFVGVLFCGSCLSSTKRRGSIFDVFCGGLSPYLSCINLKTLFIICFNGVLI